MNLIELLLERLLLGCDAFQFGRIRFVEFLSVLAQLALAAVERLALLPEFVHFRFVVVLLQPDQLLLLPQPLLVGHLRQFIRN